METLILLGAGASADAGIPTAFDMTPEMIKLFQKYSHQEGVKILRFVAGGLQFRRGILGEDPFEGINVEGLFTAIDMLAKKHKLEIAPFVAQWSPFIDEFEKFRPDPWDFRDLTDSLTDVGNTRQKPSITRLVPRASKQAAQDFGKRFKEIINKIIARPCGKIFEETNAQMINMLVEMVWLTDKKKVDYLVPLVQQAKADIITITTLNYDNTIELAAESVGIPLNRGIDYWSDTGLFKRPDIGVDLLKLHGSIDWYLQENVRTEEALLPHEVIKQIPKDRFGKTINRPAVIFGAGNKLTARGPFLELFRTFQKRLDDHDELLVIGYSFRDEHINEVIYGWLNRSKNKRIVIIDRDGTEKDENIFYNKFGRVLSDRCKILNVGARSGIKEYFGIQEEPSEGISKTSSIKEIDA